MKHVLLILDGASDVPLAELNGRTPLEAAFTPCLDGLAPHALVGRLATAHEGFPVESLVCVLGMLGYTPASHYPSGRASLEALAHGLKLETGDLAFRCNIVRVSDDGSTLRDFTAGMIDSARARQLLCRVKLPFPSWELHGGQGYRNLLIVRQAGIPASSLSCPPPHMHVGEHITPLLPRTTSPGRADAEQLAHALRAFLLESFRTFTAQPRLPDCHGNMLWVWSASGAPRLPAFRNLHGMEGTVVAGLDFMRGLAVAARLNVAIPPGATGYIDTDYTAKVRATCTALETSDMVILHLNAPDEAAHLRKADMKIQAIETIDRLVLTPLLHHLRGRFPHAFSLAVCIDHMTRVTDGKHAPDPTPCLIWPAPDDMLLPADSRLTEKCAQGGPLLSAGEIVPLLARAGLAQSIRPAAGSGL